MRQADADAARPWLIRAIAAARAVDDRPRLAEALATTSIAENMAGRPDGRRTAPRRGGDHRRRRDAPIRFPSRSSRRKPCTRSLGATSPPPDELSVAGEQLCRASGDLSYLVQMLLYQGQAAIFTGDVDRSTALLVEALRVARQLDDRPAQFDVLTLLVWPASTTGRFTAGRAAARRRRRSFRRKPPPD